MDADEKLMELKKAYAGIILNISKEAAARVLASEKKALRYEHELKMAKEEGLRMLVHLKQMMDSKINEAETSLLDQQKKIEELNDQLRDAGDFAMGLGENLKDAHTNIFRLERINYERIQEACESNSFCPIQIPAENKIYSYPSKSQGESPVVSECDNCYDKEVCMCKSYIENQDSPRLYRNGCTQRIRAYERIQLNRKCFSENTDIVNDRRNETELEEGKATIDKSLNELEKKLVKGIEFESFTQKRKRTFRQRQMEKSDQLPELSDPRSSKEERDFLEIEFRESSLCPDRILKTNSTETIQRKPVRERVIKHTFERKWKRQALSNSDVNAPLETEIKREDKPNGDQKLETPLSSFKTEKKRRVKINGDWKLEKLGSGLVKKSTSESRRLAQVAHQLISMSERKSW